MWTPNFHSNAWEHWTLSLQVSLKASEVALDYYNIVQKNYSFQYAECFISHSFLLKWKQKPKPNTSFDDFMATYLSWIWIFINNTKAKRKYSAEKTSATFLQHHLAFTFKRKLICSYIFYICSSMQQATKLKLSLGFSFCRRHQYKNKYVMILLATYNNVCIKYSRYTIILITYIFYVTI